MAYAKVRVGVVLGTAFDHESVTMPKESRNRRSEGVTSFGTQFQCDGGHRKRGEGGRGMPCLTCVGRKRAYACADKLRSNIFASKNIVKSQIEVARFLYTHWFVYKVCILFKSPSFLCVSQPVGIHVVSQLPGKGIQIAAHGERRT